MTGVPAATLRAWERRYGIPVPARTASSYRVYSDVDIEMIQRLRKLCDGGMSPSEAARLVLDDVESTPAPNSQTDHHDPFEPTRNALMRAVESFDPRRLERELDRATALGTAATIVEQVFRPVLVQIGTAWHEGRMTVAQEHLATEAITSVTRRLLSLVQPDGDAPTILLACFADDDHGFAVLALAVHLATWGWRVVSLGPRTPPSAIRHAVTELRPELVGLSCSVAPNAHRASSSSRATQTRSATGHGWSAAQAGERSQIWSLPAADTSPTRPTLERCGPPSSGSPARAIPRDVNPSNDRGGPCSRCWRRCR